MEVVIERLGISDLNGFYNSFVVAVIMKESHKCSLEVHNNTMCMEGINIEDSQGFVSFSVVNPPLQSQSS
jgi:hypothetical protein